MTSIDIATILTLKSIFTANNWNSNDGNEQIFEKFCTLLSKLTSGQQQLILELTSRYKWISLGQYLSFLVNSMNKINFEALTELKEIVLFPVMSPADESITKSGHTVLYFMRSLKPSLNKFKHFKFLEIETYDELFKQKFENKDKCILLLDDYVGSGETVNSTIIKILNNSNAKVENIKLVCIACQSSTSNNLRGQGIDVYAEYEITRGISDHYTSPELETKMNLMIEIEKLIPDCNYFNFGYNKSEALITLLRTPDNTFPIFWKEYIVEKNTFEAPFPRE